MKRLLFVLFTLISFIATAQKTPLQGYSRLPREGEKVVYTAVVPVEGVGKDLLFTRAKEWSARNFKDSKEAEQMNDREAGTLVAKCAWHQSPQSFTDTHANLYEFTLAVYVKDGRFMYRLDNFSYQNINPALLTKDAQNRVPIEQYATVAVTKKTDATLKDFDAHMRQIVQDLTAAMTTASPATSKEW